MRNLKAIWKKVRLDEGQIRKKKKPGLRISIETLSCTWTSHLLYFCVRPGSYCFKCIIQLRVDN